MAMVDVRTYNYGIVGGGFMGGEVHPEAVLLANKLLAREGIPVRFALRMLCDTDEKKRAAAMAQQPFQAGTHDLDALIAACDIVDCCVPNAGHKDVVVAAAKADKHVICEKPLGWDLAAAKDIHKAVVDAGVGSLVSFCYRGAPAAMRIHEQRIEGKITCPDDPSFQGSSVFLQDYGIKDRTNWRFGYDVAGAGGIIDDLIAHCVDLVTWLLGEQVVAVQAHTRYVTSEVGAPLTFADGTDSETQGKAVDCVEVWCHFANGRVITMSSSRFHTGEKAFFETKLHGLAGAVKWELQDHQKFQFHAYADPANEYEPVPAKDRGWQTIRLANFEHAGCHYVPGLTHGYGAFQANLVAEFGRWLHAGCPADDIKHPTVDDGLRVQQVTTAMIESGRKGGARVEVEY